MTLVTLPAAVCPMCRLDRPERYSVRCDMGCGSALAPRPTPEVALEFAASMGFERNPLPGGDHSDVCSECARRRDENQANWLEKGGKTGSPIGR